MVTRVDVSPTMLGWASERSGRPIGDLERRFASLGKWLRGERRPTLKQLVSFAKATYTPVGLLLLPEPPIERLPVPDYRTIGGRAIARPSADLLDTIFLCEQRQEWYRDYVRVSGGDPVAFISSLALNDAVAHAAAVMRDQLQFDVAQRTSIPSWTDALREFGSHAERLGILVMISGIVGSNTHRVLNPDEFRAFAIADPYAPLVFATARTPRRRRSSRWPTSRHTCGSVSRRYPTPVSEIAAPTRPSAGAMPSPPSCWCRRHRCVESCRCCQSKRSPARCNGWRVSTR